MNLGKLLLLLTVSCALPLPGSAADIFLVRHAEKQADGTSDPSLTAQGLKRAADLAILLSSAGIKHVYTTDFRRTRLTAEPLALQAGIESIVYDHKKLPELATRLGGLQQNALVVGHSNTTPELVNLLGGDAGPDIPEWQYDRVYLVRVDQQKAVEVLLLHLQPMSKQ